jgi:hypothetical protein
MTSRETLPNHLTLLPDESMGRWAMWRTVCVRGAGFPAADVLKIADADCAAAADRLIAVEEEAERLRQSALEALRGELEGAGKDRLDILVKAIRKVKRSQPAATEGLAAATAAAIEAWKKAVGSVEAEKASYQTAFAAAEERIENALREVARTERFREAVVWQNRHAAETGLASFLRRSAGSGRGSARDRGHVQMLASYLQRYCTKNDTIGFFGPVGWAHLSETGEAIAARPGEDLIASRQVYLEGWAIDAIADRLAEEEAMRPWLAPRLSPYIRKEGNLFITPNGDKIEMGPLSSALLGACDGTRPARELIRALGPDVTPDKEAILAGLLADLHSKGMLRWSFQIPLSPTPERTLRELLLAIEEEPLRERSLAVLDEIERGRDTISRAAGNAEELERALNELEATFQQVTGKSSTRAAGQLYAGRTLVYEDCRRDLDLELGSPFLAELAPALTLVLASARWLTYFAATRHREMFKQAYEELREKMAPEPVDVLTYSRTSLPRLLNIHNQRDLQQELNSRWERVFSIPPGQRRVHYRSEDLRPLVLQEFPAPGPGWQKARHHSPDLMIAAPSLEAIRKGDYHVVLGEVHVSINTLDRWLFFCQHTDPDSLRAAMESDLPEPSLIPVFPKIWNVEAANSDLGLNAPAVSGRMDLAFRSDKDFYLDFSLDPPGLPSSQILRMSDLVVERDENGSIVIGPRDGRVRFEAVDFYQLVLVMQMLGVYRVLPSSTYTPRVTIDRLVVARESWIFRGSALEFAQIPTAPERYAAARRWAAEKGLPRFVFAKTPIEPKPFYIDLESPILVEGFAKAIRAAVKAEAEAQIHVSEMMPGHEELWLPDAQGNRYTCELRTVVVDQESPGRG